MLSSGFKVNITGADSLMKKKLELHSGNYPDVQLFFINHGKQALYPDLLVIPDRDARTLTGLKTPDSPPVICYGCAQNMGVCMSAGCADFLCSPWTAAEFFERVRLGCRRRLIRLEGSALLLRGDTLLLLAGDNDAEAVFSRLTEAEQRLMRVFTANRGCYFSRGTLSELLRGADRPDSRKIDMNISRLRGKISALFKDSSSPHPISAGDVIKTKSGCGWGIM